ADDVSSAVGDGVRLTAGNRHVRRCDYTTQRDVRDGARVIEQSEITVNPGRRKGVPHPVDSGRIPGGAESAGPNIRRVINDHVDFVAVRAQVATRAGQKAKGGRRGRSVGPS